MMGARAPLISHKHLYPGRYGPHHDGRVVSPLPYSYTPMNHIVLSLLLTFLLAPPTHSQTRPTERARNDSLYQLGIRFYAEGQYARAIETLKAVTEDSLASGVAFYTGVSYAAVNDFQEARRHLESAVDFQPSNTGFRLHLARLLGQAGMLRDAEKHYEAILLVDSGSVPALTSLGLIANDRRDYERSSLLFGQAVRRNPRDYLSYFHLGSALTSLGKGDSARIFLSTSLTLNHGYTPAALLLASLHYRKQEYDDALRLYTLAGQQRPENADTWYKIGLCLEKLGDHEGSVNAFRTATVLDSLSEYAFAHLGQGYFQLGRFDSAAAAYQRAAEIDDENPIFFLNLALAWERLDSTQHAVDAFHRSIAAYHPDRIGRVYSQLGALHYNRKKFREARDAYRKALQFDPSDTDAYFYVAVACDRLRDSRSALAAYKLFLKTAGEDPARKEDVERAKKRVRVLQLSQ
jgi:tetratricopeptide (TPR) repeat protein